MCESAWTIAFAGLWLKMWTAGIFKSIGSMYVPFMETFHSSYKEAAWPGSLSISVMCVTGPIAGVLSYYISSRTLLAFGTILSAVCLLCCYWATTIFQITLIYGLGVGFGIGLIECICPIFVAQNFFKQRRAVGVGITMIGSSLGQFFLPMVVQQLLRVSDVHGTFLVLGALCFHGLLGVLLLRQRPEEPEPSTTCHYGTMSESRPTRTCSQTYWDSGEFCRVDVTIEQDSRVQRTEPFYNDLEECQTCNPSVESAQMKAKGCCSEMAIFLGNLFFMASALAYAIAHFGIYTVITILPDYAFERSFTESQGYFLLSLNAAAELTGKLLMGWLSFYHLLTNTEVFALSGLMLGTAYILVSVVRAVQESFIVFTLANGYFGGALLILMPVLSTEYVGCDRAALGFGICTMMAGLMSIVRPFLVDYVKTATGSYDLLFRWDGVAVEVSMLLIVVAYVVYRARGVRV